ncbi:MAG: DUF2167 domain-containing protein, partial [Thalassolituus sp.]
MKKLCTTGLLVIAATLCPLLSQAEEPAFVPGEDAITYELSEEEAANLRAMEAFLASLNPQTGTIELPGGLAKLEVPESFYYLSPEDTKRVLEDAWGNPPDPELSLGMLFPAHYSPLDSDAWGVTIDYSDEGYVSDEDAADIDYSELLSEMQADTRDYSAYRIENGYDSLSLVGWAETPYYDDVTHKLYWAKELQFGDSEENTLNYNVRVLGREGYLVMNFIAGMSQLGEVSAARDDVLAMAEFTDGNLYSQFDPEYDKVAAYG